MTLLNVLTVHALCIGIIHEALLHFLFTMKKPVARM